MHKCIKMRTFRAPGRHLPAEQNMIPSWHSLCMKTSGCTLFPPHDETWQRILKKSQGQKSGIKDFPNHPMERSNTRGPSAFFSSGLLRKHTCRRRGPAPNHPSIFASEAEYGGSSQGQPEASHRLPRARLWTAAGTQTQGGHSNSMQAPHRRPHARNRTPNLLAVPPQIFSHFHDERNQKKEVVLTGFDDQHHTSCVKGCRLQLYQ